MSRNCIQIVAERIFQIQVKTSIEMKIYAMISHWPSQAGISVLTKKFVVFWLSVTEFILLIMVANFDKSRQKKN